MSTRRPSLVAFLVSGISFLSVLSHAAEREAEYITYQGETFTAGLGPEIVPELGISVNNSTTTFAPRGLLVCWGWKDESGSIDPRTSLGVGDLILRINGQAISDPINCRDIVQKASEQGKPLVVSFKKRRGDPLPPNDFMSPQSRMEADAFQYEQKFRKQEISVALAKELADTAAPLQQKALAEQAAAIAAHESKTYTAKDGRAMTIADIVNHNKSIDAAMQALNGGVQGFDARRLAAAQSNVSWVVKHVQSGDRQNLRTVMVTLSNLPSPARRDIDFFLQQTPAGNYIAACNNGEAVTWLDAYAQGLGALIEVGMGLPLQ